MAIVTLYMDDADDKALVIERSYEDGGGEDVITFTIEQLIGGQVIDPDLRAAYGQSITLPTQQVRDLLRTSGLGI